ncbi:MAG: HEAT repeat domain-containing protein [Rivularia sp. (in: cyanobacteria)]
MVNFNTYLQSISDTYAQWWNCYTITDVVGKQRDELERRSAMLPLSPFFDFGLMVEKVKQEQKEKTERLTVIEGLRKYACNHVLLIGRPGSGKSTALLRVLLESSQSVIATEAERKEAISTTSKENEQIPILVELRFYQTSIIDLIRDFLLRHDRNLPIDSGDVKFNVSTLLRQGKFLLLIDGVNELPSEAARQDLQKFRQDYQQTTPMIFTTRDLGVGGDLGIEKKLQMQPLTEAQMREFVCGYLPEQGEEMLKQLEGRLRELGETPLLLMMLCSVFASNQNKVPANLGLVFRRFTEIYDNKFKQDIPVTDESRRWWKRLLQHLAWVMTHGESKTEILVAIPIQEARDILTKFLKEQDYHQPRNAESWLDDLLKHHLIQLGAENQIQFRHQLLQEYYAAERLLEEILKLNDDELQWEYLNYLKWTEVVALMMHLLNVETQNFASLRLVKLALEIDWQLGARLAGEVKEEWQGETVGLIDGLEIPALLKIRLLGKTKSEAAIPGLIFLLEDEDEDVRYKAADALEEIKSEAAIPGLIKLLQHKDSDVRYKATYVLGEIKSEALVPEFIKLIEDEDEDVRSKAVDVLEEIKSEAAIPGLIKLFQHEDSDVRSKAVYILGKISSEAVIPEFIKLAEDEDSDVRSRAAYVLKQVKSEAAIPELIKFFHHENSFVRNQAAYVLGEIKSEAAIPELIKCLHHENSSILNQAAYTLGKLKSEAAIPELIKFLENEDSSVRKHAADALGEIKSEAAIPGLIKLLRHENLHICFKAVYTLGKLKSEAAIPELIKLLEDDNSILRYKIAHALIDIQSETAIPGLIKLVQHKNSDVRYRAANVLIEIKSEAAIPGLIELVQHENSDVRYRVAYALGKIKPDIGILELTKLLEDRDLDVRNQAKIALGRIKPDNGISETNIIVENKSLSVGDRVVNKPRKITSEASIPGLTKSLEYKYFSVGYIAANSQKKIISEAAIPRLIKLLKDKDLVVRCEGVSALIEIKSKAVMINLIRLLNNQNFLQLNNGENSLNALNALEKIQQHLKYYKPIPKTMSNTCHNYALLIGVGECEETKLSLPVTVKDIQAVKSLLTDSNLCGYIDNNIRLLYNETATKEKILENLTWLKQQAENDSEATILIYYSGHGCLDNSGNYYLIPHETDRADIPDTALSAETINQALQEIPAQRLLVIIDSCHAQGMATSKDAKSPIPKGFTQAALPKTIIDNLKGTGRVVFTSSTGEQLSWIRSDRTMSIYTYHFLEALQGAGNQPGDKTVKVSHLMNYLSKTVPSTTQQEYQTEQTPFFDFATEDFPVALLRGGKGLPQQGYESVKAEVEENIRSISNQVKDGVGIVGDGNIGFNIGTAGNITFGDISSK